MKVETTKPHERQKARSFQMQETLLALPTDGSKCMRISTATECLDLLQARARINTVMFQTKRDGGDVIVYAKKR